MENKTLELSRPPVFVRPENGGYGSVSLSELDWARMLVDYNVTDAEIWPPGMREGAALLARIREIEAACIAAHGSFDWEALDEDTQDRYDGTVADLEHLLEPGPHKTFEEVFGRSPNGKT